MLKKKLMSGILSKNEIEQFIHNGYIRIEHAFSPEIAAAAVDILWNDLPCERANPSTWTEPVIRLGMYTQQPFVESVNSKKLHSIFDQLVGKDRWIPCRSVGTFPIRFPSVRQPNDTGKHVDVSFPGNDPGNYLEWRANIKSRGRALLMLVLYSDVGENDAPTLIDEGSHMDVARLLAEEGDSGLSFTEIADKLNELPERKVIYAKGRAGTVFLCHPFLVHSAQPHYGVHPKFMAQPPLLLRGSLNVGNTTAGFTPVEQAIRLALY